jgi:hypothetical protein
MLYELRVYHANPGKLEALQARFRDHTLRLFEKHGITNVGYWTNSVSDGQSTQLWYLLAHRDFASSTESWKSFRADPEWQSARARSEENGPLVERIESFFLNPTDFSPLK